MDTHDNLEPKDGDQLPPDRGAQGDVTTTGHSTHDAQAAATDSHGAAAAHDAGHGGAHGADTGDVSTLVPTTWAQLILPAIILIFVAILVAGPIFNAFAPRPATSAPAEQSGGSSISSGAAATPAQATPAQAAPTSTQVVQPTATTAPTQAVATPTTASSSGLQSSATQTVVALAGAQGEVARVPVALQFAGSDFTVQQGGELLPDWKPSDDTTVGTWIANTVANHIIYISYSDRNKELFQGTKPGDLIKLTMNTGQVFNFSVTRSARAVNGPATAQGQFTVRTAMTQDHAGVTLILIGDPASDRAVVQADFNGTIQ